MDEQKKQKIVDEEVQKTIESLDTFEKIKSNPYLSTRIIEELKTNEEQTKKSGLISGILQPAAIAVLFAFGIFLGISIGSKQITNNEEKLNNIESMIEIYDLRIPKMKNYLEDGDN